MKPFDLWAKCHWCETSLTTLEFLNIDVDGTHLCQCLNGECPPNPAACREFQRSTGQDRG